MSASSGVKMIYKFSDLKMKEVIHITDGERIGFVSDIEVDFDSGKIISLIVPGAYRGLGFFGKEEDVVINWQSIKKIGDDLIIIDKI